MRHLNRLIIPAISLVFLTGVAVQAAPPNTDQTGQNASTQGQQPPQTGQKKPPIFHKSTGGAIGGPGQGNQGNSVVVPSRRRIQGTSGPSLGTGQGAGQPGSTWHRTTPPPRVSTRPIIRRTERFTGPRDYTIGHRPPNWNNRPTRFNRHDYYHNYVAAHRYHWRPYIRPHGWFYRRWVFGQVMPRIFWVRNYWITDFWMFGLTIPPYGCEWVRYGDDAILIDVNTGEILQVVYGIFD